MIQRLAVSEGFGALCATYTALVVGSSSGAARVGSLVGIGYNTLVVGVSGCVTGGTTIVDTHVAMSITVVLDIAGVLMTQFGDFFGVAVTATTGKLLFTLFGTGGIFCNAFCVFMSMCQFNAAYITNIVFIGICMSFANPLAFGTGTGIGVGVGVGGHGSTITVGQLCGSDVDSLRNCILTLTAALNCLISYSLSTGLCDNFTATGATNICAAFSGVNITVIIVKIFDTA